MKTVIKSIMIPVIIATAFLNGALADTATIMIDSLSIRIRPEGQLTETVDRGTRIPIFNYYQNWGRESKGWIDTDFTRLNTTSPSVIFTEKIKGKFLEINKPTIGISRKGKVKLEAGKTYPVVAEKNNIVIIQTGNGRIAVPRNFTTTLEGEFPAGILIKNASLISPQTGREITFLKKGTFCIKLKNNLFLVNGNTGSIAPVSFPSHVYFSASELLNKLNIVIDTFNSARVSSAITERLGYFPKVLPLKETSIRFVNLENGKIGVFINLKYLFYDLNGEEIKDRKTRLILKKGNEVFWQKLSKEVFESYPNAKFVQLNIFRFNGKGSFEKEGFVAAGITDYKSGICDAPPEKFMKKTESELSEDLWFFANEVYERVENDN
ncbi:hypothetical protein [Desulfurobacterium sp.]